MRLRGGGRFFLVALLQKPLSEALPCIVFVAGDRGTKREGIGRLTA
jgi:hypothetical protein